MATLISNRFGALLRGDSPNVYDQPLFQSEDYVTAPSLGAIIPGWLIVVPKASALNFRCIGSQGLKAELAVAEALAHLKLQPTDIIWFEHGPAEFGSVVGCGADYAHIHILIRPSFSFNELVAAAEHMAGETFLSAKSADVYTALQVTASYIVVGQAGEARHLANVERLGSQFMRRVIASLSGTRDEWDYKKFPHNANIIETVAIVRALESAAESA